MIGKHSTENLNNKVELRINRINRVRIYRIRIKRVRINRVRINHAQPVLSISETSLPMQRSYATLALDISA